MFTQFDNSYFYDGLCKDQVRATIAEAGAHRATLLGGWALFGRTPEGKYDIEAGLNEEVIRQNMPVQIDGGPPPYILNIEHRFDWPLSYAVCEERFIFVRDQMAEAVRWVHRFRADARVGMYAHFPRVHYRVRPWLVRDRWDRVKQAYGEYMEKNEHLAQHMIELDFCAPSLYPGVFPAPTSDPNPVPFSEVLESGAFEDLVILQCETARRLYRKPAYCYIQCRDYPRAILTAEQTSMYLDVIRRHADGAIMWTTRGMFPDGLDTPWFQVYLEWVREHNDKVAEPAQMGDPAAVHFADCCMEGPFEEEDGDGTGSG